MTSIALGKSGVELPVLGFGTWRLRGEECRRAVKCALETGYRSIDTASIYQNEEIVGEVLEEWKKNNAGTRIFLTSKAGTNEMGFDNVYSACLRSLGKLKVDTLDLYLLHWPGADGESTSSPKLRSLRKESWKAMEKLYREGKTRAIGVSNYYTNHLEGLLEDGVEVVPMVNQIEHHPKCLPLETIACCKKNSIVVQAYSPLACANAEVFAHSAVLKVAKETGRTAAQVLLRWAIQREVLVAVRSSKEENVKSNFLVDFELSESQMDGLTSMGNPSNLMHVCWNPETIS